MKLVKCTGCEFKFDPIKLDRCPECGMHYLPAKRSSGGALIYQHAIGYGQCDWKSAGDRCHFPGTMSGALLGGGPWYCSGHFECSSPLMGADIVKASLDYRHPPDKDDQTLAEAAEYCKAHGLNSVEDMRKHVKKTTASMAARMTSHATNTQWAGRIIGRIAGGEKLPLISERLAKEALGLDKEPEAPLREPGEDLEEQEA